MVVKANCHSYCSRIPKTGSGGQVNHLITTGMNFGSCPAFNSPFSITPAPRKPMPETICAAILEVEFGSICDDKNVKIIEPPITSAWLLIPAGLPFDSFSPYNKSG